MRVLNTREVKRISDRLETHWGFRLPKEVYLMTDKGKLFMAEDISPILGKLRMDRIGLYIAKITDKEVRLSIEGSQIFGPVAVKNVVELDKAERDRWIAGEKVESDKEGPLIIRSGGDYFGSGIGKNGYILNYVPKERRITELASP